MGHDVDRNAALARIERVFTDVPRPRNDELLHPACADDGDIRELSRYARWQDVPDAVVEREYAALSFLSAEGFRHFLPAYLRFVLRNDDLGQAAIGSTLAALDPGRFGSELEAFQRSKYVAFTEDERRAIGGFLDVVADHEEIGDAVDAWPSGS
jgi:hypothetical protein